MFFLYLPQACLIGSQFKLQRNVVLEEEKRGDLCCAFVGFV
jgi:hypothetical protein